MRKTTFTKDQLAKYGVTSARQLKIYNESYNHWQHRALNQWKLNARKDSALTK